jgi:hydrogenase nickel incorporation protein HypA/HybF
MVFRFAGEAKQVQGNFMHEMSLAENVLQIIEESARTQNFRRVRSVVLEIGRLAAVESDAMRFCFDAVVSGSIAEGARLEIIETPGEGRCMACGMAVAMQEPYGLCPECGSPRLQVLGGDRMRVVNLEVE